jgi:hypothetical protein
VGGQDQREGKNHPRKLFGWFTTLEQVEERDFFLL